MIDLNGKKYLSFFKTAKSNKDTKNKEIPIVAKKQDNNYYYIIYIMQTRGHMMKDATIMLRVTTDEKLVIKRMARKKGMTITEFMLFNMMKSISESELSELEGEIDLDLDLKKVKKQM